VETFELKNAPQEQTLNFARTCATELASPACSVYKHLLAPREGKRQPNMSFRRGMKLDDDDSDFFGEGVKKFRYGNPSGSSEPVDEENVSSSAADDDDEVDPLDAFMAEMEKPEVKSKPSFKGKKVL
jgi:hypothetical protein